MSNTHFRLIFQGLHDNAQLRKLVTVFQKELALSEDEIRNLLTNPPRVLWEITSHNDAELIETALDKMGCQTSLEAVMADSSYPFVISQRHHKLINRELSKILRTKANLVLFLVQVATNELGQILPSMMGSFQQELATHFRESDTVIGIDDRRIIILGFSTDRSGAGYLENKTNRVLKDLLGNEILVTTGFSLFPQEGRSLSKLLDIAEARRKNEDNTGALDVQTALTSEEPTPYISTENEMGFNALHCRFTQAHGRIFKRLLDMDPETLWLGLSRLPQAEQRAFLARLPFDSPLTPALEEMINTQHQPIASKSAEQHFEAIIHHMELEEGLEARKDVQAEVFSQLNRAETLPTLPSIAAHIFSIASNPNTSAGDLTKVIVNDPPLTSKLLKIVNSAFYGFPQKISSVKQAVVILGIEEIMDLAFGLAAAKVFEIKPLEGLYDPKSLWRHSMSTALIAQNLCQGFPQYQKLGGFTAGLLHDFGKIFLIENFPERYGHIQQNVNSHELPPFELEGETFGLDHAATGQFLASNWNLPDVLVQAIAFHHQPFSATSHSQLAAIIGLADYLYYQASISLELPEETPVLFQRLTFGHWAILTQLFKDLNSDVLKKMTQDAVAILKDSQDLFAILD